MMHLPHNMQNYFGDYLLKNNLDISEALDWILVEAYNMVAW